MTLSLNKIKIEHYNNAAYLSNGKIILNITYGKSGDSTSSLIRITNASYESLVIKSLNFLSFMKKKIKSEDFIKIDVEGGEYKLLPFIGPILRKRKPNIYLAPHRFLIDSYFNKIFMTNKLLFSLRGYKYISNKKERLD